VSEKETVNHTTPDLGDQATALRRELAEKSQILADSRLSDGKKIILFVVLFGTICSAVALLIFEHDRRQLLATLTEGWIDASSERGAEILRLPPPPPKEVEPQIRYPETFSSAGDFEGVLYSSSSPALGESEEEGEQEPEFVNPVKTKESEAAYEFLIQNSETAGKLAENLMEGHELKKWQPVRIEPPVFFIDLVVTRTSDDRELHLVWEVDLEAGTIRALSQAARDLRGS